MNSLILISPYQGSGFQPILWSKKRGFCASPQLKSQNRESLSETKPSQNSLTNPKFRLLP